MCILECRAVRNCSLHDSTGLANTASVCDRFARWQIFEVTRTHYIKTFGDKLTHAGQHHIFSNGAVLICHHASTEVWVQKSERASHNVETACTHTHEQPLQQASQRYPCSHAPQLPHRM